jgi:hypothetical protein
MQVKGRNIKQSESKHEEKEERKIFLNYGDNHMYKN